MVCIWINTRKQIKRGAVQYPWMVLGTVNMMGFGILIDDGYIGFGKTGLLRVNGG